MIEQTSISYYGLNYVEHAEADFAEMKAHGVTCVILAVTEFDFDFWRPNIPKIVEKAHELGLKCVIDPWGNGKYFGGEQVSKFLQDNVENRQVSALTGEKLPYACFIPETKGKTLEELEHLFDSKRTTTRKQT